MAVELGRGQFIACHRNYPSIDRTDVAEKFSSVCCELASNVKGPSSLHFTDIARPTRRACAFGEPARGVLRSFGRLVCTLVLLSIASCSFEHSFMPRLV